MLRGARSIFYLNDEQEPTVQEYGQNLFPLREQPRINLEMKGERL